MVTKKIILILSCITTLSPIHAYSFKGTYQSAYEFIKEHPYSVSSIVLTLSSALLFYYSLSTNFERLAFAEAHTPGYNEFLSTLPSLLAADQNMEAWERNTTRCWLIQRFCEKVCTPEVLAHLRNLKIKEGRSLVAGILLLAFAGKLANLAQVESVYHNQ